MRRALLPEAGYTCAGHLEPDDWHDWDAMAIFPLATVPFIEVCGRFAPPGFHPGIVTLRQSGRLIAGAPMFEHKIRLDMSFDDSLRGIGDWISRVAPRLVRVPLICLGSPLADSCALVLDRGLDARGRKAAVSALIDGLLASAREARSDIIAIKDLPESIAADAHGVLIEKGFTRIPSLPVAVLDLPFATIEEYLASLSAKMRSDLRRKMRQSAGVELTVVEDAKALAGDLDRLFEETRARSKADYGEFDAVAPGFFAALLTGMGEAARLVVTRVKGEIAGFNIFLTRHDHAIAFKIGLSSWLAREHNLYFMNWLWMVEHCIANGITRLDMGQTTYGLKLRLGCRLESSWIYFRHRNAGWNQVFKLVGPHLSFARMDPDLRETASA